MYLRSYLLFICVHILLYCCSMHLHAGSFPLSEISIRALGLTPGLATLSPTRRCTTGTSQVQDRGQSVRVVGARVILEITDDIWSVFIFYVGYVVLIRVCIDCCISRQMSCK